MTTSHHYSGGFRADLDLYVGETLLLSHLRMVTLQAESRKDCEEVKALELS